MTAFIVSLGLFMDALDTTIINTAIPTMANSLNVQPVDLKIALISYLISLAIFIPISGWLGDKYGIKRVFIIALGIFTISSLWCGAAQTLTELTIARSCQGLGGALMLPLGRLIILHAFKRHELVSAMNAVVTIVSLGIMLGPVAGGFITDRLSWHWIFWVNIPIGILVIIIAIRHLIYIAPKKVGPFNIVGFILFGGSLAILTFSLSYLSESHADQFLGTCMIGIALCMLITCLLHAFRESHPIIKVSLLSTRTFQVSVISNLLARIGFGGIPFLLPLLLQIALGLSAEFSGLLLTPIAIGILAVRTISLPLLKCLGYKKLLIINTLLIGTSLLSFQIITQETSYYVISALTFIFGLLISLLFSAINSIAFAEIATDDLSAAMSIISTVQQLSQSFGVASGALLLRYYSHHATYEPILTTAVFHQVFFTLGILTCFSAIIFLRLQADDGHQMLKASALDKISSPEVAE